MLFHSFLFIAFFGCVWLVTVSLPHRWRNPFLLVASQVFYAAWSWKFLALLWASTLLDYVAGRAIGSSQSAGVRRAWLAVSVVGHLGALCFFKYYDFFVDALDALLLPLGTSVAGLHLHLVLPLGLSFYTLQTLGYTIDVYRGHFRPVHDLVDFSLFVGFFPQILAGPIARAPQFVPQVRSRRRIDGIALREGAYLCLWGYFKKVVLADNLARIVDPVYARGASPDGLEVVIATLGFTVLAYADFSGYTDIARGTARMLGFQLLRNFDTPYLSRDMGELWRRWHMSLSFWLRDYLFLSLGGSRVGPARLTFNLWTTLFVAGLWHGSTGSFVLFGIFHGTMVAALRPAALGKALPEGWRLANLALPGSGPVVGEFLLRRILAAGSGEPPPRLVVLHFSTLSLTEWRPNFVEYPLTHLLPLGPVLRAAWAEGDLGYLLEWVATRLPTLRHREELKSGALSLLFDRWPGLADRYRAITRDATHDALFRWRYAGRAERNHHLAQELLRQRGWHRFDEMRLPGGELDARVRYDRGAFYFPPFVATPREERSLAHLLDLCEAHSIPVLVLPSAQPRALTEALDQGGGAERLDAFARRAFGDRRGVAVPLGLRMPWPHRFFGDLAHVNEAGLELVS